MLRLFVGLLILFELIVEREIEIFGEALYRLRRLDEADSGYYCNRNLLVHDACVWSTSLVSCGGMHMMSRM